VKVRTASTVLAAAILACWVSTGTAAAAAPTASVPARNCDASGSNDPSWGACSSAQNNYATGQRELRQSQGSHSDSFTAHSHINQAQSQAQAAGNQSKTFGR
jgi:hypothetical protein